ncbi:hypothetical protein ERJ75_001744900 [Trypanosoma vivax]|nr:hypothetical protein ERJ75_001744900 [Trypanosoma vivax]
MENRPALQPREVKFTDLAQVTKVRNVDTPQRGDRRRHRPVPQRFNTHAAKAGRVPFADGVEAESGDEEERRRGRQRGQHETKMLRSGRTNAPLNMSAMLSASVTPIEISGSAVPMENESISGARALAILRECVVHERQLKEELALINASKAIAFRNVINVYLASVTQDRRAVPDVEL